MYLHCQKCLCSQTGDVLGAPCRTPGCDGVITEVPDFRTLVDELPEPMTCGRRFDTYVGDVPVHYDQGAGKDHWLRFKTNGDRTCSYCGSLHPDDMFRLVKASADAPEDAPHGSVVEIEPSDKPYKIYVNQPGVRNAHEGGIKFYTQHLPRNTDGSLAVPPERNEEYKRAVHNSHVRFEKMMKMMRGARP
jgi:hypothetical protein